MMWLRKLLGGTIVAYRGPCRTYVLTESPESSEESVRPEGLNEDVNIGVKCQRITFVTEYARWWVPNTRHTLYKVCGYAPPEHAHLFHPDVLVEATYPLLCSRLLEWTPFPRYYAIRAYFDRLDR